MENKSDFKYITIPLSSIKRLYTHPKTAINDIFDIGILQVSKYENIEEYSAIKQVLYCYYREYDKLTRYLKEMFEYLIDNGYFSPDEDYNGFSGNEFDPEDDILSIRTYINQAHDKEFKDAIMQYHAVRQVKGVLNISFNTGHIIDCANKLKSQVPEKDVLVTIKTDMMFDYLNNKKTAYEIDIFACYLGIRSILGKKEFCYTTRNMILCRMIGCKSKMDINTTRKTKELRKTYDNYSKKRQMSKILDDLAAMNFISKIAIPPLRRTYISTKLNMISLEKAIHESLSNDTKRKIVRNKQAEKEAALRILQNLR